MAQFPHEQSEVGAFERQADAFRDWVSAPEAGRYHLYVCKACPWAHRTWLLRNLMGLEAAVSVNFVDPIREDATGWAFREGAGHGLDEVEGFAYLAEAYKKTDPGFSGRVTVPVLWDRHAKKIVNNSEDDICKMWAGVFRPLARHPIDLFPPELEAAQTQLSEYIYEAINNGVYTTGFASTQAAYEASFERLFTGLDRLDLRLAEGGPFLFGERLVETDFRLFCTLVRFDAVYFGHFKCNQRQIADYPHLQAYLERIYRMPGVAETVDFDQIKRHYYYTHDDINPSRIVPLGPKLDWARAD
ncbi:MAG: glutathione S-transferase family protein [Puniceicoccaceae bacterium]|nr:MAG: glutathione S-transferase family protein [Puniceicoccaceae bacterium]